MRAAFVRGLPILRIARGVLALTALLSGVLLVMLAAVPAALSQTATPWPEPDNSYEPEGGWPPSTPYPAQVQEIAWSPNGELIAVGSGPPTCYWESNAHFVRIFDVHTGALVNTLIASKCPINDIDWSWDSEFIASSSYSQTSWTSAVVGEYPERTTVIGPYPSGYVQNVWSPTGDRVASAVPIGKDEVIIWRNGGESEQILLQIPDEQATSVTWRPDGQVLALSSLEGGILLHDSFSGQQLQVLTTMPTYLVAWSPDGRTIAGVNEQHTIQVWDAQSGALQRELPGHTGEVEQLRWSGDSRYLLTASHDGTIRTWDTETGESVIVEQRDEPIFATDWDPAGRWIVVPPLLGTSDGASPMIVPNPLVEAPPTPTPVS